MDGREDASWAGPGDPGFNESVAVADRREMLLALPWPGSAAVACGGGERLIVAADQVFPDDEMRSAAHDLVEAAWAEVLAPAASPETLEEARRSADALYEQCERVPDRGVFRAIGAACMIVGVVLDALREPSASRSPHQVVSPLMVGLEDVAEWASTDLQWRYGSGDRYAIADIYRSEAFVRELAAWDADLATVQQQGVSAESVAAIRRRARDVGLQHQQTIIRALTVDRPSSEELERRCRDGP